MSVFCFILSHKTMNRIITFIITIIALQSTYSNAKKLDDFALGVIFGEGSQGVSTASLIFQGVGCSEKGLELMIATIEKSLAAEEDSVDQIDGDTNRMLRTPSRGLYSPTWCDYYCQNIVSSDLHHDHSLTDFFPACWPLFPYLSAVPAPPSPFV